MRAAFYESFGPPSALKVAKLADPVAADGEVLVRVAASGVNPVDVKRRAGGRGAMSGGRVIPHFDGAGVIEAVGPGVPAGRIGERVWLFEAQWQRLDGTAAERVALPASRAVPLPDGVDFAVGAALGIPALTAHRCVFADGPVEGQTILVTGGAGAVGRYAVQFAKLGGARVLATASSDAKAASAAAAGAEHVIRYRDEDVGARASELTDGRGVDRVVEVEFGGNVDASLKALRAGGVISTYASQAEPEPKLPFYQLLYKNVTVRCELVFLMPEAAKQHAIADLGRWLADGRLSHDIGARFPLDRIAAAHEAVESGAAGKVVVTL